MILFKIALPFFCMRFFFCKALCSVFVSTILSADFDDFIAKLHYFLIAKLFGLRI